MDNNIFEMDQNKIKEISSEQIITDNNLENNLDKNLENGLDKMRYEIHLVNTNLLKETVSDESYDILKKILILVLLQKKLI